MGLQRDMAKWAVVGVLVLFAFAAGEKTQSVNDACTNAQNELKTKTAQAVLDCGNSKCKHAEGNSLQEQACLCANCVAEDKAARESSCACGLSDPNSAAACQIYQRMYT